MKRTHHILLFTIIFCFSVLLSSCSGGIQDSEAKAHINEFFAAIAEEDYGKAESMLHPEHPVDLALFFTNVEKEKGVDFQDGVRIQRYTGFSSSFYHSNVKGSRYALTMDTTVGEKAVKFTIEIVKNDAGYGIYDFEINA